MNITKISNVKIKPVHVPEIDQNKIKGHSFFPILYSNIGIVAKKHSGKSSIIHNVVLKSIGKNTKVFIISSTVHKDQTYKDLIEQLDRRKILHYEWLAIDDSDDGNVLKALMDELRKNEDVEKKTVTRVLPNKNVFVKWTHETEEQRLKREEAEIQKQLDVEKKLVEKEEKKKKGKHVPEVIIILDDLGVELRNKMVTKLTKTNRHFRAKVLISAHALTDLQPSARKQLDYILVSKGFNDDKLEQLYKDADISIDYDKFVEVYKFATEMPYSFLFIDTRDHSFRRNFDYKIEI